MSFVLFYFFSIWLYFGDYCFVSVCILFVCFLVVIGFFSFRFDLGSILIKDRS